MGPACEALASPPPMVCRGRVNPAEPVKGAAPPPRQLRPSARPASCEVSPCCAPRNASGCTPFSFPRAALAAPWCALNVPDPAPAGAAIGQSGGGGGGARLRDRAQCSAWASATSARSRSTSTRPRGDFPPPPPPPLRYAASRVERFTGSTPNLWPAAAISRAAPESSAAKSPRALGAAAARSFSCV